MKKFLSICSIIALMTTMLVSLSACFIKWPTNSGGWFEDGNGKKGSVAEGTIYSPYVNSVSIVLDGDAKYEDAVYAAIYSVFEKVDGLIDASCRYTGDQYDVDEHEIVLGNTNRDISAIALERAEKYYMRAVDEFSDDAAFFVGYCVYAYQGSVAFVWINDLFAPCAIEYFLEKYFTSDTLILKDGYCDVGAFNAIDAMREKENAQTQAALAEVANIYGEETATLLKNFRALYDERLYLWMANLYEPGTYDDDGNPLGGGFYYSNSARDAEGFLPDLESTHQVLEFVQNYGMASSKEELLSVLPESMINEIVAFVLSCQSPKDGYFYHPQWGTSITTSRRGRDLNWATSLLALFGESPYWNTPNGVWGTKGNPPGTTTTAKLVVPLSESKVSAASRAIAASSAWTGDANLATISTWETYLKSFSEKIKKESYSIGNTFASMASQIKNRDKLAIRNGEFGDANRDGIADGGYIETWKRYFDSWQNESNGLWCDGSVQNGTITYSAINGLMKIAGVYNNLEIKMNNAHKAFEAAVYMTMYIGVDKLGNDWGDANGDKPDQIVDVYNTLDAMNLILSNIDRFGSKEEYDKLRSILRDNSEEFVSVVAKKTYLFQKNDGSYGYTWTTSPSKSQGAFVAIPDTVEGDVNGAIMAVRNYSLVTKLLDVTGLQPYNYSDFIVFANEIGGLGPVIKYPDYSYSGEVVRDFEEEFTEDELTDDKLPKYIAQSCLNGSVTIIEESEGNHCVELNAVPGKSGNQVAFASGEIGNPKSCVLEWDMKFGDINKTSATAFQVTVAGYILTIGVNTNGTFTLGDSSSTGAGIKNSFDATFNAHEWNNIRIEFYQVGHDTPSTVAYIYVNGYLRFVSDNYVGKEKSASPNMSYSWARFYALAGTDLVLYIDNVNAHQSRNEYTEKPIENPDRIKHFDDLAPGGSELPVGVNTVGGEITRVPSEINENNNAIVVDKSGESVTVFTIASQVPASCYSATMKMKIASSLLGEVAQISLSPLSADKALAAYKIEVYEDGGKRFARISEINKDGAVGRSYDGIETNKWIELSFEFYPYFYEADECSIIYLNGKELGRGNLYFDRNTLSMEYKTLVVTAKADATLVLDDIVSEIIVKDFVNSDGQVVETPNITLPKPGNWGSGSYYNDELYAADAKYSYDGLAPEITKDTSDLITSDSVSGRVSVENDALCVYNREFALKNTGAKEGATFIFETDLFIDSCKVTATNHTIGWFGMSATGYNKNTQFASFAIQYTAKDGNITRVYISDSASASIVYADLEIDAWQNIRIEYTPGANNSGMVKFYLNGELTKECVTKGYGGSAANANTSFECFGIQSRADTSCGGYSGYIRFDNTFMSAIGEAQQLPPEADEPIKGYYGEGEYYNNASYSDEAKYNYDGLGPEIKKADSDLITSDSESGRVSVEKDALSVYNRKFALSNSGAKAGAIYVFETDLYIDSYTVTATKHTIGWFGMSATGFNKSTQFASFAINYTAESGNITRMYITDSTDTSLVYADLELDAWQNIRIEYTPNSDNTGTVKFYLNGELAKECVTKGYGGSAANANTSFECFGIESRANTSCGGYGGYIRFDNTFMSAIGEAQQLPPEVDEPIKGYYGKGEYYNNASYSDEAKYTYDGLAPEIKKASSDLMTSDSESGRVSVEDDALSVYTRKFGLVNGGAKTGATYVFETDLYMDSDTVTATNGTIGWIGMSAGASNKTAHFASFAIMYKATDGNITRLYISDAAAVGTVCVDLELETWQNLRIEYTPNSDNTGTVRFYLNGELTKEYVTNGYGGNAANANTSFECFGIESRADTSSGGYGGYIRLDNTFMSAVTNN